jgi:hypothetical protein
LTRARVENNIRITAMIGTGLIATATAYVSTSEMLVDIGCLLGDGLTA